MSIFIKRTTASLCLLALYGTAHAQAPVLSGAPQAAPQQAPAIPAVAIPDVKYDPSSNNINATKKVDPNSAVPQASPQGIPAPNLQPPVVMPQQYSASRSGGQMDEIESTLTILNAPNSRIRQISRDLYTKGRVLNETKAPKSRNGMLTAHLSPGSTSPVIRLHKNRTSTFMVTDITGQPWPIVNFDGLPEEDFIVKRLDAASPNGYIISVTPIGSFVSGNLVVVLKGNHPLNIEFIPDQKSVDATTEIRVQAAGPNSNVSTIGLPKALDTSLLSVLQGVAPAGAKPLRSSTGAVQAWLAKDGNMYVRTRYKIKSPAFTEASGSPDGTFAYKMVPVPVVLYQNADGKYGEFKIDGF